MAGTEPADLHVGSLAAPAPILRGGRLLLLDGRLGMLVTSLAEEARAAQLGVVGLDQRREAEEDDPDERRQANRKRQQDRERIPVEDARDDEQAEDADRGPQQPLFAVHQRRVPAPA